MDRLDQTLGVLSRPGFSVLVLDDYADTALQRRQLPPRALGDLFDSALHLPAPTASPGGVLVAAQHLDMVHRQASPPTSGTALLGVALSIGRGSSYVDRSLGVARRVGASFVEIRANRRPGQFPRGEAHVDASAVAAAATLAQGAGLVPVITVALPAMPGGATGVTRAIVANGLRATFEALGTLPCDPGRLILRLPLISPGPLARQPIEAEAVARHTLAVLDEAVPAEVPAIWFLSAGQPLTTVCAQLTAITRLSASQRPRRRLGAALGRAFVEPALDGWTSGGQARAEQQLATACSSVHRALLPALTTI